MLTPIPFGTIGFQDRPVDRHCLLSKNPMYLECYKEDAAAGERRSGVSLGAVLPNLSKHRRITYKYLLKIQHNIMLT